MKISIVQNSPGSDPAASWVSARRQIEAVRPEADLILLPGDFLDPAQNPVDTGLAETVQRELAELARAKSCHIAAGSVILADAGCGLSRTTWLFERSGALAFVQSNPFSPGDAQSGVSFPVIDTDMGKIGILNGPDIWVWETSRILSLQGAELILAPGVLNDKNTESKLAALWGLATLNCVAVAFAGAASRQDGSGAKGCASVILPSGVLDQRLDDAAFTLESEIGDGVMTNLRNADLTFKNTLWFGLWSRRKQLYGPLTADAAALAPANGHA